MTMLTFQGPRGLRIEVFGPSDDAVRAVTHDATDVYGNGLRWSFQGGKVIIDFGLRLVLEEDAAMLHYRIVAGDSVIITVGGIGIMRTYRGGKKVGRNTYQF